MNLKVRCCCPGESQVVARFVEIEPVIQIPVNSYIYANTVFFLDLGADRELSPDLELYAGGSASTAQIPILLGYVETFVPDSTGIEVYFDDNTSSGVTNFGQIFALRHRGWRIKQGGLQLSNKEFFSGEYNDLTRIVFEKPGTRSDDLIEQVDEGGFYFLGGAFDETPALVQQRTSVDQDGNSINYFVGYNPRRECSRPEQARTYGTNLKRLVFDFTTEFPDTITITFTYLYRFTFSTPIRTEEITRTYSKFVAGAATRPTFESVTGSAGGVFKNVDGFTTEDPEDSNYLVFGYRSTDCTDERNNPDSSNFPFLYFSAPCMPVKYVSFGARDSFFADGTINLARGDNGQNLSDTLTDDDLTPGTDTNFLLPNEYRLGVVMSDVTLGPNLPQLRDDVTIGSSSAPSGFGVSRTAPTPSTNSELSAMSYKGTTALNSIHTLSIESAYVDRSRPRFYRGQSNTQQSTNLTIRDTTTIGFALGTIDFPAISMDSRTGSIDLENMTNPFTGAYHFLTDGLSEDSDFPAPQILPSNVPLPPPITVSLS